MYLLIITLLAILVIGVAATALAAIVEFVISSIEWVIIIGLILVGVVMLAAGAGWVSAIPIALGFVFAGK